jgi:DUF4097 and DUF4098 domain-containing protein YvlB
MSAVRPTRLPLGAIVLACSIAGAGCEVNLNSEGVVARETKTFTITGVPELLLDTFDGSIEIHSWERPDVEVEIEKRAMEQRLVDEMTVTAEQQGDRVVVKVTRPSRRDSDAIQIGVNFSPTARLRVAVPRASQVTAVSGDGSITIDDIAGKITLTTNDGSVRASRVSGELTVRSGDGSIRMDRIDGKLDVETEDGSIIIEAKPTVLRARTSDGSVRLEIERDAVMAEDWDVQTADGSVVLSLPPDFNGELDAESRDGAVRVEHPAISTDSEDRDRSERRQRALKTRLGSGGRTLRVRTGDGTIRIES